MPSDDSGPLHGDAFGEALLARFAGVDAEVVIERDDGFVDVDRSDYFTEIGDGDEMWRWLRARLGQRVLDVGAGAGRGSVKLQREGVDVVALDISAGALEVCRRRGVTNTFTGTVEDLAAVGEKRFNSFLCLGNNLGLLANRSSAASFLEALRRLGSEDARLVGTMLDPYITDDPVHLAYHERNRAAGRLPGNVRIRVRHHRSATAWFELLWASPDELADVAENAGWRVTDLLATGAIYAAELRPR